MGIMITDIDSKKWYDLMSTLYNIYKEEKSDLTDVFLFIGEPKLRYLAATHGTASEYSLIALLDEFLLCGQKNEELKATIIKLIQGSIISEELADYFIKFAPPEILVNLIENPSTPQLVQLEAYSHKSPTVKHAVARVLGTEHKGLMDKALSSKDLNILEGLLQNPLISEENIVEILKKFKYELPALRSAARNINTPYHLMVDWSRSKDHALQRVLASNPIINLEIQEELSCSADERTLINLATNPNLTTEIAERFLSSLYPESVRIALASNPSLPLNLTTELLSNSNPIVRAAIIKDSPHASVQLLSEIALDESDLTVIKRLIEHPLLPHPIWKLLYNRVNRKNASLACFYRKELSKEALEFLVKEANKGYKYLLYLQPNYQIKGRISKNEEPISKVSRLLKSSLTSGSSMSGELVEDIKSLISIDK
jgi:hypothetical protein